MDIYYKIKFHSDWHCGSGLASGADVDALVVKDKDGLPFVPGKTIKGLIREAVEEICNFKKEPVDKFVAIFGHFDGEKGLAFFTNAELPEIERKTIVANEAQRFMFRKIASTAIDKNGIADEHSLRKMEVVIPCTLEGKILDIPNEESSKRIKEAFGFIKRLGQNRNRGLGRCTFEIDSEETTKEEKAPKEATKKEKAMNVLKFKCTLLSDVILNQKAATEGPNETLDFIPGSNFLGIVAGILYPTLGMNKDTLDLFHGSKVRFGDAHPSIGEYRGLKVPASMYYPKLQKPSENLYIHHAIKDHNTDELKKAQLKQCRRGYYDFSQKEAIPIEAKTSFAIKSAYDRDLRRSKDEQMYGYQSLQKGLVLYFSVEIDDDSIKKERIEEIKNALTEGYKRIGRSRTAQYGLVDIEECDYKEIEDGQGKTNEVVIYADSRLIFLDQKDGMPTFQPTVSQLLGDNYKETENGKQGNAIICWDKCQIRTFKYAPYNYARQCFDTDRCGIEKGSVFVVQLNESIDLSELKSRRYIGSYNNEGFGRVIYNPDFLTANEKGIAMYGLKEKAGKPSQNDGDTKPALKGSSLLCYLALRKEEEEQEKEVYVRVNRWVSENANRFEGKAFASQWGTIRSIAMSNKTLADIKKELFEKTRIKDNKPVPDAYLTHGVAEDKWAENGRLKRFKEFFDAEKDKNGNVVGEALNDNNVQMAVINLAAEMAKKCKEGK